LLTLFFKVYFVLKKKNTIGSSNVVEKQIAVDWNGRHFFLCGCVLGFFYRWLLRNLKRFYFVVEVYNLCLRNLIEFIFAWFKDLNKLMKNHQVWCYVYVCAVHVRVYVEDEAIYIIFFLNYLSIAYMNIVQLMNENCVKNINSRDYFFLLQETRESRACKISHFCISILYYPKNKIISSSVWNIKKYSRPESYLVKKKTCVL
jgi:hypothetical protein